MIIAMHQPIVVPPGPLRGLELRSILRAHEQRYMHGREQGGVERGKVSSSRFSVREMLHKVPSVKATMSRSQSLHHRPLDHCRATFSRGLLSQNLENAVIPLVSDVESLTGAGC